MIVQAMGDQETDPRSREHVDTDRADPPDRADRDYVGDPDDPMGPPKEPCECTCLHCGRVFMSSEMWFQRVRGAKDLAGFWLCPTPNCSGAGFTIDIFPTDPNHPANEGWHYDDDEDEDDDDEGGEWSEEMEEDDSEIEDYDPAEPHWKQMEDFDDEDDDIEGEEWKHGLAPGERPSEPAWMKQAREQHEAEQRRYDQPDERPREVDYSDRPEIPHFGEDDIPF